MSRYGVIIALAVAVLVFRLTLSRQQARAEQAKSDGTWSAKGETRQAVLLLLVYCVGIGLFLAWVFWFTQ